MSNFKEIYPQKNFVEELHRMDSLKDDGYEVLAFNGVPEDAPLNAEYCYDLKKNTKIANGKEISVNDGINMPLESLKIFGEASYSVPGDYVRLQYIDNNATAAYIDTGIVADSNLKLEIDFQFLPGRTPGYTNCFGAIGTDSGQYRRWHIQGNGDGIGVVVQYMNSSTSSIFENKPCTTRAYSIIDMKEKTIKTKVGNETQNYSIVYSGNWSSYINFWLFRRSGIEYNNALRIYSCKMYKNGEKLRDFIPVKRKDNNEAGLFDLVTNTFFGNPGGGSLTAGPEAGNATMDNPVNLFVIGTYNPLTQLWNTEITDGDTTTILEHEQPLCSLGDECKDMYDNGMLCYKTQYKQLTDNLNWKVDNVYTNDSLLAVSVLIPDAIKQTDIIYCTHFTPSTDMTQANHIKLDNSKFYLTIDKNIVSSLDDFLQWLRENKLVVIYNRKSVEKIPVVPYILLNTHEGTTTITNDQNADMEIEYRVGPNAILWHREENGEFVEVTE